MSRDSLQKIITDFDLHRFKRFFSEKNRKFKESSESLDTFDEAVFCNGQKLGAVSFDDGSLMVCAIEVKKELTERSGKKAQYEIGKKILKSTQTDAGIFIFHDQAGAFRFSLIYANYLEKKRDWSTFRRFTYFVSDELTNKTFLQRIGDGDFSSLAKVKEAFSVEKVTKEFYQDIANWYFWALKHVRFPKDAPKESDGLDHVSVIRLITQLIFCWFVKQKGLIPDTLFDEAMLANVLDGFAPDRDSDKNSVFYKAILQNLFFATLNTEMDKRGWVREEQNFMTHSLYRHKERFHKPSKALGLFKDIPFLNGGLFECLDRDLGKNVKSRYVRVDGFSRRPDSQPTVPDFLFFGGEREADLSADYGQAKYKKATVRGLIHTLGRYNFTIEENTLLDQEVALDPELSGKVFENLLAAYNPETGSTARKQTGSFYTPREIVSYMADEALIAYLKTSLEATQQSTDDVEARLRQLFAYNNDPHSFTAGEVETLIAAIDNLKALDPAVGSGAFPMGILHRLVFILGKLDPRNEKWKERQVHRVRDAITTAERIEDAALRDRTVRELEQQIAGVNDAFERNELDYGRKLYLIENCIYGVDIQPIAVQIAKMRFFISLIVDQKIDHEAPNLGIRPLPNLETKFVAANTLIGVVRPGQQLLRNVEIDAKEAKLRRVRERHFNARTLATKAKYREQDAALRAEIAEMLKDDGWDTTTARRLSSWDPYDQNISANFFDPEWMFGLQKGFQVVIANPPYVDIKALPPKLVRVFFEKFKTAKNRINLYAFFIEKSFSLLADQGVMAFINPNSLLVNESYTMVRKLIAPAVVRLIKLPDSVFDHAVVETMLLFAQKGHELGVALAKQFANDEQLDLANIEFSEFIKADWLLERECRFNITANSDALAICRKLDVGTCPLENYVEFCLGITPYDKYKGHNRDLIKHRTYHADRRLSEDYVPLISGSNILRYVILPEPEAWLKYGDWLGAPRERRFFTQSRIIVRQIVSGVPPRIYAGFTRKHLYHTQVGFVILKREATRSDLLFFLALINSQLMNFYHTELFLDKEKVTFQKILIANCKKFPVCLPSPAQERAIVELVSKVIEMRENDAGSDTAILEREIDRLVYALYGLTPEEIGIVEKATVG